MFKIKIYNTLVGKKLRLTLGKKSVTIDYDFWASENDNIETAKEYFNLKYGMKFE